MGYDGSWNVRKKCFETSGTCYRHLKQRKRWEASNWMHLVCGVGDYSSLLTDVAEEGSKSGGKRYLPIAEEAVMGTLMAVDGTLSFTANPKQNGELICFANDSDGLYHDNSGGVSVTITRNSWPPSVEFDVNYAVYLKESLENPSIYDSYVGLYP